MELYILLYKIRLEARNFVLTQSGLFELVNFYIFFDRYLNIIFIVLNFDYNNTFHTIENLNS